MLKFKHAMSLMIISLKFVIIKHHYSPFYFRYFACTLFDFALSIAKFLIGKQFYYLKTGPSLLKAHFCGWNDVLAGLAILCQNIYLYLQYLDSRLPTFFSRNTSFISSLPSLPERQKCTGIIICFMIILLQIVTHNFKKIRCNKYTYLPVQVKILVKFHHSCRS